MSFKRSSLSAEIFAVRQAGQVGVEIPIRYRVGG